MILVKQADQLHLLIKQLKIKTTPVCLIPTMGALHPGHISLLTSARQHNGYTICSIFVNPTQFSDPEDFKKYPVTTANDIAQLEKAGCEILFLPSIKEIYPDGTVFNQSYDFGMLENMLEGKYRPGHFKGVCQVVDRLLNIVQPDLLYLGQKDYQQCMVIKRLVAFRKPEVKIIVGITKREPSGLAMSSRNLRLTANQRSAAAAIYQMLNYIKDNIGPAQQLKPLCTYASQYLLKHGFTKVDYISVHFADTLQPADVWDGTSALIILVAAYIGNVRLIDNLLV